VDNQASRNALQKCGLKFVEKFTYNNEIPCDWLHITRQQWVAMQQK
jgi:RimJ/RimL family protein N-acetyltransferase